jgi:hypothetical protein
MTGSQEPNGLRASAHDIDFFTSRTDFSASVMTSYSDDQALWTNAAMIDTWLFGQSVSGWTRSSPKSGISYAGRIRNRSLPAGRYEHGNLYANDLFCSSFAQAPVLGFAATKRCR